MVISVFLQEYEEFSSPYHLKANAGGRKIVMVPLIMYSDDTSGNKSKQWNKFDLWCIKLAGLPNTENSRLHNIHFICCSNECDALDMSQPITN